MIIYLSLFIYHYLSTYLPTYVPRIPLGGPTRLVQPESSKPTSHNWGCFAGEKFYYMNTHTYIYIYIASVVILKKKNMEVSRTSSPTCEYKTLKNICTNILVGGFNNLE